MAGGSIAGFYTPLSALNGNADDDTPTTVNVATTLPSLRFNNRVGAMLIVDNAAQLKLGGVLVTPNTSPVNISAAPNGGSIIAVNAAGRDLIFFKNSGQPMTISAAIANTSAAIADTTNLVKEGAGELILSGANTYTGKTYVHGGLLRLVNSNIGGSTVAGNVFIREGELRVEGASSVNTGANFISIGQRLGETGTLTLQGNASWTTAGGL